MQHWVRNGMGAVAALALLGLATPLPAQDRAAGNLAGAFLAARVATTSDDFTAAAAYWERVLRADPDNINLRQQALFVALGLGDFEAAVAHARVLAEAGDTEQLAQIALLADEVARGDFAAAANAGPARDVIGPLAAGLVEGWAHLGTGSVSRTFETFDAVSDVPGLAPFVGFHRALAFALVGDFESADTILSDALGGGLSLGRRGLLARLQVLGQLGRFDEALALIESQFGDDPDRQIAVMRSAFAEGQAVPFDLVRSASDGVAEVLFTVAALLEEESAPAFVLVYARAAQHLRPDAGEMNVLVARLLGRMGQTALAEEVYSSVPSGDPYYIVAQLGRADVLNRADRADEAHAVLDQLAQAFPEEVTVFMTLGDLLRREERFEEAAEAYSAALALIGEPREQHWSLLYARAITYERSDRWDLAERDFRAALALAPEQPFVLNYLGYSLVERRENLSEALDMIERAVAAEPENGYIVDSLGWALYRLGRHDEAVAPMERAVELEPVDAVVNDHLGDVYWAVGRFREARFQWRRALSFGPADELDMDRVRRKLDVGLDQVLIDEGADPHHPVADDAG